MVDLVLIGAIIYFCHLGDRLIRAYEHDVYENEDYIQIINDKNDDDDDYYR